MRLYTKNRSEFSSGLQLTQIPLVNIYYTSPCLGQSLSYKFDAICLKRWKLQKFSSARECISWFVQWNNSILNYLSELFRYKYFSNSPMLLTSPCTSIIIQAFLGGGRAVIIFQFPLGVFIPSVSCLWYWGCNVAQQWHWHISILADHCWFSSPRHPRHSGLAPQSLNTKQNINSTFLSCVDFTFVLTNVDKQIESLQNWNWRGLWYFKL